MKHPDPDKLRSVARRLKLRAAEPHVLNMNITDMHKDECGTHACIAGHWMDIRLQDPDVTSLTKDSLEPATENAYYWGLNLMSFDVGLFHDLTMDMLRQEGDYMCVSNLSDWASANPKLWGNSHGGVAFEPEALSAAPAWTEPGLPPSQGLQGIADHMLRVADRIEEEAT